MRSKVLLTPLRIILINIAMGQGDPVSRGKIILLQIKCSSPESEWETTVLNSWIDEETVYKI
jgi:hypothetical protein